MGSQTSTTEETVIESIVTEVSNAIESNKELSTVEEENLVDTVISDSECCGDTDEEAEEDTPFDENDSIHNVLTKLNVEVAELRMYKELVLKILPRIESIVDKMNDIVDE